MNKNDRRNGAVYLELERAVIEEGASILRQVEAACGRITDPQQRMEVCETIVDDLIALLDD
jgi:hypothetical protein